MIKHKHQQLYDLLSEDLRRGTWPCNEKLPNLKELAARYNVSINVASKAVELLKEAHLVSVKVGDGIYSETSGQAELVDFKYSGERLFGQYAGAKTLRILMQDNTEFQLAFWNGVFDAITLENPDIELQVSYNMAENKNPRDFDIGIASPEYLAGAGLCGEALVPADIRYEFGNDFYEGLPVSPSELKWKGKELYFPFAFITSQLLFRDGAEQPESGEDVLDYIERLVSKSNGAVGYGLLNCRGLVANSGLDFADSRSGEFRMPEKRRLMGLFHRARKLYQRGDLVWMHGRFSDYAQICKLKAGQPIHIVECPFNRIRAEELKEQGLRRVPYPDGHCFTATPLTAVISRGCRFPEEALRVIRKLLQKEVQRKALESGIFLPLHHAELERGGFGYLAEKLEKQTHHWMFLPDPELLRVIHYFFAWEFFYYLNGQRDENIYELIEKKIQYYLSNKEE